MSWYWSWLLTIVGVTGFILAGRKIWYAWYVNIGCQGLWFTYAIVSHQYGFIAASIVYVVVFSKNAYEWTKEHKSKGRWYPSELSGKIKTIRTDEHGLHVESVMPTGPVWNSIKPDNRTISVSGACQRFHPGEECRPGDNHPEQAEPKHQKSPPYYNPEPLNPPLADYDG
jgi:hypothetical protein